MSGALATAAGAVTVAAVLLLGLAGRRPPVRRALAAPREPSPGRVGSHVRAGVIATIGAVMLMTVGPLPVLVVGAGGVIAARRRTRALEARRRRAVDAALPDAVELLVLCIHAGRSPSQAIVELAARSPPPLRMAFAAVEQQQHRGRSLADALGELRRHAGPGGRDVAVAIATADRDGLPLAPVLERLAADARSARRRLGEEAARRLPVRLTFPLVACTLPSFVLLAIAPAVLGALSTLRANAP